MQRCVTCNKLIWPWQKTGFNPSWHRLCTTIWEKGYASASKFCIRENEIHGLQSPFKLYGERSTRERIAFNPPTENNHEN